MKALPDKTLAHYCDLYPIAARDPDSPIDVKGINPSCIRAMYKRGLIEYEFVTMNDKSERRILFTKEGLRYGCESLALVTNDNSKSRQREVLRVYLDMGNEDHKTAWDIARSLAGQRIFTPVIVDLLLMHSEFLRQEDTTFAEAYPGMYKLMTETRQEDLIQRLESLLQNTRQSPVDPSPHDLEVSTQGNAPRVLTVKQFSAPPLEDEDDEDLLTVSKDLTAGARASSNFLKSLMALND